MWEDEEEVNKHHSPSKDEILYGHVDTALSEQILAANKIVEEVIKEEVSDIGTNLVTNMTEVVAEIIENSKIEKHVSGENITGGVSAGIHLKIDCFLVTLLMASILLVLF